MKWLQLNAGGLARLQLTVGLVALFWFGGKAVERVVSAEARAQAERLAAADARAAVLEGEIGWERMLSRYRSLVRSAAVVSKLAVPPSGALDATDKRNAQASLRALLDRAGAAGHAAILDAKGAALVSAGDDSTPPPFAGLSAVADAAKGAVSVRVERTESAAFLAAAAPLPLQGNVTAVLLLVTPLDDKAVTSWVVNPSPGTALVLAGDKSVTIASSLRTELRAVAPAGGYSKGLVAGREVYTAESRPMSDDGGVIGQLIGLGHEETVKVAELVDAVWLLLGVIGLLSLLMIVAVPIAEIAAAPAQRAAPEPRAPRPSKMPEISRLPEETVSGRPPLHEPDELPPMRLPKSFGPHADALKSSGPHADALKSSGPHADALKSSGPHADALKSSGPHADALKSSGPHADALKPSGPHADALKSSGPHADALKSSGPHADALKSSGPHADALKSSGPQASAPGNDGRSAGLGALAPPQGMSLPSNGLGMPSFPSSAPGLGGLGQSSPPVPLPGHGPTIAPPAPPPVTARPAPAPPPPPAPAPQAPLPSTPGGSAARGPASVTFGHGASPPPVGVGESPVAPPPPPPVAPPPPMAPPAASARPAGPSSGGLSFDSIAAAAMAQAPRAAPPPPEPPRPQIVAPPPPPPPPPSPAFGPESDLPGLKPAAWAKSAAAAAEAAAQKAAQPAPPKPPAPLPPVHAPPPAPPVAAAPSALPAKLEQASTMRPAPPPAEAAAVSPFDESHYRLVYEEFVGSKRSLGEAVANITYDGFSAKLRTSEQQLIDCHGCRAVRFQVLVKDKQVSLRPQLVR